MRRAAKIVLGIVIGGAVLASGASAFVLWKAAQPHDAPYPQIAASQDPHVIERGRYLAYGPGHCVDCHSTASKDEIAAGGDVPLTGGYPFVLPVGAWYSANLTSDKETGLGASPMPNWRGRCGTASPPTDECCCRSCPSRTSATRT